MRHPVETNVYLIPERLKEIDPNLKVAFNDKNQSYEVWGVDAMSTPYILSSFKDLDARVVYAIREAYVVAQSTGDPYRHMLRQFDRNDEMREREYWKRLNEQEYVSRDILKFSDTPVITAGMDV